MKKEYLFVAKNVSFIKHYCRLIIFIKLERFETFKLMAVIRQAEAYSQPFK